MFDMAEPPSPVKAEGAEISPDTALQARSVDGRAATQHLPPTATLASVPITNGCPSIRDVIEAEDALRRVNIRLGNVRRRRSVNGRVGTDAISRYKPGVGAPGRVATGTAKRSAREGLRPPAGTSIGRETFASLLPAKPYCTDYHHHGLIIRPLTKAIEFRHIQTNHPNALSWIILDLDRSDAATAWEDENLPMPSIIVINPKNGHGHYYYLLRTPVQKFDTSSQKALAFYAAIERGLTRRLKADVGYSGLIGKNPLHSDWRTIWGPSKPYALGELDRWLDDDDKAPVKRLQFEFGVGRNCSIFDSVRKFAYARAIAVKKDSGTIADFRDEVESACHEINQQFEWPLGAKEVGRIAKSVACWTWHKFSVETQSRIQAARARKRWKDHVKAEPWERLGISRRTYFRRKAAGTLADLPLYGMSATGPIQASRLFEHSARRAAAPLLFKQPGDLVRRHQALRPPAPVARRARSFMGGAR